MIDYFKINKAVGSALSKYKDATFPINVYQAIVKIPDIALMTYKEIIESGLPYDTESDIINRLTLSKDGALLRVEGIGYLLAYNDDGFIPYTRIRWTLAHELGHYYLKHLDDKKTIMSRGGLSNTEYKTAEKEANAFARDFLANPAAVYASKSVINAKNIARTFELSNEASRIIANKLNEYPRIIQNWSKLLKVEDPVFKPIIDYSDYYPSYGENVFAALLKEKTVLFNFCSHCHALNSGYDSTIKYCSVCGNKTIKITKHNFKFHETEEQDVFEYKKFEVEGTPSKLQNECMNCGNKIEKSQDFCDVCGKYLINRCSGISIDDIYFDNKRHKWMMYDESPFGDGESRTITNKDFSEGFTGGCDHSQSGKARFCAKCGSVTTFMLSQYFKEWNEEQKLANNQQEDALPF